MFVSYLTYGVEKIKMTIDTNTVVSMTDANQNFSKVTKIVDQYGKAVVFKNNAPRYLVIDFNLLDKPEAAATTAATEDVLASASKMMDRFDSAFETLAK